MSYEPPADVLASDLIAFGPKRRRDRYLEFVAVHANNHMCPILLEKRGSDLRGDPNAKSRTSMVILIAVRPG